MAEPKITFIQGQGGLGRATASFDQYSLMVGYYYASSANTAYANIGNKIYTSIFDAETDGVVNTFAEATAATSAQTVTTAGTNDDVVTITFTDWNGTEYTLGTYKKVSADNTVTLVATGHVAAINANTYITGFSATVGSSGAYTIAAPKRWGIYPNSKSVTHTFSSGATMAITNNAFANGTKSDLAMFHYQISEYFRRNPSGNLFFSIKFDDSANAVSVFNTQLQSDVLAAANLYEGQARQVLVYNPFRTFATSTLGALSALRTTLFGQQTDGLMIYGGGYSGALSAQANLRALTYPGVSAVLGQSGTGVGFEYSKTQQQVILSAGACLGDISTRVSGSIAEGTNNVSDGAECEKAYFFDGTDYKTISQSLANQLHDYGWIYLKKFVGGYTGTYWNSGNCAVSTSSDYAYIEDNKTFDKAKRGIYLSCIPLLNRKNQVKADGTLADSAIAAYEEAARIPLNQMVREEDLSNFSVSVSRTAVVATTGIVPITVSMVQQSIGREIKFTLGFVAKL